MLKKYQRVACSSRVVPLAVLIIVLSWLLVSAPAVLGHANLVKSSPAANSVLPTAPDEIRLWFSEPLEPDFSRLTLRQRDGGTVDIPPARLAEDDAHQLFVPLAEPLPDDVYTVVWRVVSTADGHTTSGSFSFTVGPATGLAPAASTVPPEELPLANAGLRAFNLLALGLLVGGLGFYGLVWRPAARQTALPEATTLHRLIWAGWWLSGLAGGLLLLLQVSLAADTSLLAALNTPQLDNVIFDTRFGLLWQGRMVLWGLVGAALLWLDGQPRLLWGAWLGSLGILALHSLNSHANSAPDRWAALALHGVHLAAGLLWLGGLVVFLVMAVSLLRRRPPSPDQPVTGPLTLLTGHFSNTARLWVGVLGISGLYAAWLQVGSWAALTGTRYGQGLLVKLVLMLPLLGVAAVNLLKTHRALRQGDRRWARRLAGLIGVELALVTGIILAVGVMTATSPARARQAQVEAYQVAQPDPQPVTLSQAADDLAAELVISPGWAGQNTFTLHLHDEDGQPVSNATLIRLRFTNAEAQVEESELNPEPDGPGVYRATGVNLSLPGTWHIRANIQRPERFDTLLDFEPEVPTAPTPRPVEPDTTLPLDARRLALWLVGAGLVVLGGWTLGRGMPARRGVILPAGVASLGVALVVYGWLGPVTASPPAPDGPQIDQVLALRDRQLPYLVTAEGVLLRPASGGQWQPQNLEGRAQDAYVDTDFRLWAATDQGLFVHDGDAWTQVQSEPASALVDTHGYLYSLGTQVLWRGPDTWRELSPPAEDALNNFVMMPNHSHLLHSGSQLLHTFDLGLSWSAFETPPDVRHIFSDAGDQVWAMTGTGFFRHQDGAWQQQLPLPADQLPTAALSFDGRLYAVADGRLYGQDGAAWSLVELPGNTAAVTALDARFDGPLWVATADNKLWSSPDGEQWRAQAVRCTTPACRPG